MINSRVLLRNSKHQNSLEKSLFLKVDFFNVENYAFISDLINDFEKSTINFYELQNIFIEKFQSKFEYKCINCSPLSIKFIHIQKTTCIINNSVVDEEAQSSLCFLIPLFENEKSQAEVILLNKSISSYPRPENLFFSENLSIDKKAKKTKLKYGEIIIAYNQIPIIIFNTNIRKFLIVNVLPYEARPFLFKKDFDTNSIQSYQTTSKKFLEYESSKNFILSLHIRKKSYPIFEIDIEQMLLTIEKTSLFYRILHRLYDKK